MVTADLRSIKFVLSYIVEVKEFNFSGVSEMRICLSRNNTTSIEMDAIYSNSNVVFLRLASIGGIEAWGKTSFKFLSNIYLYLSRWAENKIHIVISYGIFLQMCCKLKL
jgi:hypothetical protein